MNVVNSINLLRSSDDSTTLNLPRRSTIRNSKCLLQFIPGPEEVYHRRKSKLASHKILEDLSSESILDIHLLFVDISQSNNSHSTMGTLLKPLDYSVIIGEPHNILDKAIEKVPSFYGNDAITAKSHLLAFSQCYNKWCHNVTMKM